MFTLDGAFDTKEVSGDETDELALNRATTEVITLYGGEEEDESETLNRGNKPVKPKLRFWSGCIRWFSSVPRMYRRWRRSKHLPV
jgi:hypothetical protein